MKRLFISVFLFIVTFIANAQISLSDKDINEYKSQIEDMIVYFEETLNFIGDPNNSAQEKDIIFKESYSKIFKDENVQIEDDLDESRGSTINKDVRAYLKDIDFFYQNVHFDFDIQSITPQINDKGETSFKVAMKRTMAGRNLQNDTVNNTINRFIEINLDSYKKELKIVSLYTTKPSFKDELYTWWNNMSKPWKDYLGKEMMVYDTIEMSRVNMILDDAFVVMSKRFVHLQDSFMIVDKDTMSMDRIDELFGHRPDTIIYIDDVVLKWVDDTIKAELTPVYETLKQITKTTHVNISGNQEFTTLEPLAELSDLRELDCSQTKISDINPIRNLNKIRSLDISNTMITDISNLKYANTIQDFKADNVRIKDISAVAFFKDIKNLSLSNTDVADISALSRCHELSTLKMSKTPLKDISVLKDMLKLYDLDISYTFVDDLSVLQTLVNLRFLNIENIAVTSLSSLSNLDNLNEINFSNTKIDNISPLDDMPELSKVYCDNTLVPNSMVEAFVNANPNVLVINETEALKEWWDNIPSFWKSLLMTQTNTGINPSKEELHSIINIKRLKVNHLMQDAGPVSRLTNLEYLDLSDSKIDNLSPLSGLHNLKTLNISNTTVSDLSPLANNKNLKELNIENTKVKSLQPLHEINSIMLIHADGTDLTSDEVIELKKMQRQVTVIYQTDFLNQWWGFLEDTWRDIFNAHLLCNSKPTPEQLQSIVDIEEIVIAPENAVHSLEPLSMMAFLRELTVNNNQINDLSPLTDKEYMEVLSVSGNPVDNITPLSGLHALKSLNLENTQVSDLTPIESLKNIKVLNIGGTSVRNLKPLTNFNALEDLSIVNTNVKSVMPIENLPSLKHFKAYKTKIKSKYIDLMKLKNPDLNVIYY